MPGKPNQALLQQAIDALRISDVYFRSTQSWLSEDFEPKYDPDIGNLEIQFKHIVSQSSVLQLDENEGSMEEGASSRIFRVFVELGVRWVLPESDEKNRKDIDVKAEINAIMVGEYQMSSDPGADALKEFALHNASYHIWPYWREYLTSQCMRMNLPKLMLPAVQFSRNHTTEDNQ